MGLGTPPQLLEMIARGVDMFDCVMPTRLARHGVALTPDGPMHIKNQRWAADSRRSTGRASACHTILPRLRAPPIQSR